MEHPNFNQFKRLFIQKGSAGNVKKYFEAQIDECKKEERHGTASNYMCAMGSIERVKGIETLNFKDITPAWLKDYYKKMKDSEKSINTISMYLRALRTLYNQAIKDNIISPGYYPFGKEKFVIPAGYNNKRPLELSELKALSDYSGDKLYEKYRDFFLLSFYLMGLNYADLLTLKWSQLDGDTLTVLRKKTEHTSESNLRKIELTVNQSAKEIINKHGKTDREYIFDVIKPEDNPEEIRRKVKNFNRNANQALKKVAEKIGINTNISTVFARHSAASHGLASGASVGDVSLALGHSDLRTTSNYISSLRQGRQQLADALDIKKSVPKTKRETDDTETSNE